MGSWLIPRTDLSADQLRAVELPARDHQVVCGAPGSGKTQVLVHRARHLLDSFGTDPRRLRIFIFTNVLKQYLRAALDELDLPDNCVSTFSAWCREFYLSRVSRRLPYKDKQPDFEEIQRGVLQRLRQHPECPKPFDFALVDEGQDLEPDAYGILNAVAGHVTVCLDQKQQIYDRGSTEPQILQSLGLRCRSLSFLAAYRCSPHLVPLAAQFIEDVSQREAFIRQCRPAQSYGETPLLYVAADFEDEKLRLIHAVQSRLGQGERVAVLLPQKRQVFGFAQGLSEAGVDAEVPHEAWRDKERYPSLDFASRRPKLLTYHGAKGLTFDSVLLPRLVPGSFDRRGAPAANVLFVGATRATKWVFMSTIAGRELPALHAVHHLEREGKLSVKTRGNSYTPLSKKSTGSRLDVDRCLDDDLLSLL